MCATRDDDDAADVAVALRDQLSLFPIRRTSATPAQLTPYLFFGSSEHALDVKGLQKLGITDVINCAEGEVGTAHYAEFAALHIRCTGFASSDMADYDMSQHLALVESTIDDVRRANGRCLLHCVAGVNRSGFLAICMLCALEQQSVVEAATHAQTQRGRVCTNRSFQAQLFRVAKERGWRLR